MIWFSFVWLFTQMTMVSDGTDFREHDRSNVTADDVYFAKFFARLYYNVHYNPGSASRLYNETTILSVPNGDGTMTTVTTLNVGLLFSYNHFMIYRPLLIFCIKICWLLWSGYYCKNWVAGFWELYPKNWDSSFSTLSFFGDHFCSCGCYKWNRWSGKEIHPNFLSSSTT